MVQLTERQKEIAAIIDTFLKSGGSSPTVREIAKTAGISPKAAQDHIQALCEKGLYIKDGRKSRSLKWSPQNENASSHPTVNIPVQENLTSGMSLFDSEYVQSENYVSVYNETSAQDSYLAFKVDDNSMKNIGILSGDIAIIDTKASYKNGDIIAIATSSSPFCLRYYYKDGARVKLQSAEEDDRGDYVVQPKILGKLKEIRRTYS